MISSLTIYLQETRLKYMVLIRTFEINPSLAELVRKLDLRWDMKHRPDDTGEGTDPPRSDEGTCNFKTNQLLALLPNIEYLRVRTDHWCWPFVPDFLAHNPVPRLRRLYLQWYVISLHDALPFLAIPNLEQLELYSLDPLRPSKTVEPNGPQRKRLSELRLGSLPLPLPSLDVLLSHLTDIKELRLGLPYADPDTEIEIAARWQQSSDDILTSKMFSPHSVGVTLQSLKFTLTKLWLWNEHYTSNPRKHDGTRLDLSDFRALRKLDVPSDVFFAHRLPVPSDERKGVWALLPSGLEEFKVRIMFRLQTL